MENPTNDPENFSDKILSFFNNTEPKKFKFIMTGEFVDFCYKDCLSAMIMSYLMFYTKRSGKPKKMYKFIEPCKSKYYRPGDSWCELTGNTAKRVTHCLDKLCTKLNYEGDETPHEKMVEKFIIGKKTFYRINEENVITRLKDWLIKKEQKK